MNAEVLRAETLGLLGDLRSAGRNVSSSTLESVLWERLPTLATAAVDDLQEELSDGAMERMLVAVSELCNAPPFVPREVPRLRLRLAWGLAGAALIVLMVMAVLSRQNEKEHLAGPREVPGVTKPLLPEKPFEKPKDRIVQETPRSKDEVDPRIDRRGLTEPTRVPKQRPLLVQGPSVGKVSKVIGEPTVSFEGSPALAKMEASVTLGSILKTGDADRLRIDFQDGSTLSLDFNTTVEIRAPGQKSGRRPYEIGLTMGHLFASVSHNDKERFLAVTPVATAEVLGTEFGLDVLEVEGRVRATLQVEEGKVAFYNQHGRVETRALFESEAEEGSAPTEPKRLDVIRRFPLDGPYAPPGIHIFRFRGEGQTNGIPSAEANAERLVVRLGDTGMEVVGIPGKPALVAHVSSGANADVAGIEVGDEILEVDGQKIETYSQARRRIHENAGRSVLLRIQRGDKTLSVALPIGLWNPPGVEVPGHLEQPLRQATWRLMVNNSRKAEVTLKELLATNPHPAVWNNLGFTHEVLDQMASAIRCYREAVRLEPKAGFYRRNLGLALRQIGNLARSEKELSLAASLVPDAPCFHEDRAWSLLLLDRHDEALRVLDDAIARFPKALELLASRSDMLTAMGRHDDALASTLKILETHSDCAKAWILAGRSHYYKGQLAEAARCQRRAIELSPAAEDAYIGLANALAARNERAEAEKVCQRLLQVYPESRDGLRRLGVLYLQWGRLAESEKIMRQLLQEAPNSSGAVDSLGAVLANSGRATEAEKMFLRAIKLDPGNLNAWLNLSIVCQYGGRLAEAEVAIRKAVLLRPRSVTLILRHVHALKDLNRFEEAAEALRAAMDLAPMNPIVYKSLGDLLDRQGKTAEAEAAYRKALELDPNHVSTLVELGGLLVRANRHEETRVMLERAIELDPANWGAFFYMGVLHGAKANDREAESCYRRVIELFPAHFTAWMNLAALYANSGRLEEALDAIQQAHKLNPNELEVLDNLSMILEYLGRYKEAEVVIRRYIALNPKASRGRIRLGHNFVAFQKRVGEGMRLLRREVEKSPNEGWLWKWMGEAMLVGGYDPQETLTICLKAVELSPNDDIGISNLGWAYYRVNDLKNAEEWLVKGMNRNYGQTFGAVEHWWCLGMVYERTGHRDQAIEAQRKALSLNPKFQKAKEALERLKAAP